MHWLTCPHAVCLKLYGGHLLTTAYVYRMSNYTHTRALIKTHCISAYYIDTHYVVLHWVASYICTLWRKPGLSLGWMIESARFNHDDYTCAENGTARTHTHALVWIIQNSHIVLRKCLQRAPHQDGAQPTKWHLQMMTLSLHPAASREMDPSPE